MYFSFQGGNGEVTTVISESGELVHLVDSKVLQEKAPSQIDDETTVQDEKQGEEQDGDEGTETKSKEWLH